jgi:hypothetical protein
LGIADLKTTASIRNPQSAVRNCKWRVRGSHPAFQAYEARMSPPKAELTRSCRSR